MQVSYHHHAAAALLPGEEPQVPWGSESVWMFWEDLHFSSLLGNEPRYLERQAISLVAISKCPYVHKQPHNR